MCGLGDVDGDGIPDLGAGYGGGAYQGLVRIYSGSSGALIAEIADPDGASGFGSRVAGPGDVNGDGVGDIAIGAYLFDTTMADVGRACVWSPTECIASSYCVTSPNTAGPGALMGYTGSLSLSANDLSVTATGCPPEQFGLFFYGSYQGQIAFGDGVRCVTGAIARFGSVVKTDQGGNVSAPIDFTQAPFASGPTAITAGSTWNFQFWYRDPIPVGYGWNLSDGLQMTFCP